MRRTARLEILSCALTGAAVFGLLFALAWASRVVADIPASRAFVGFFVQQALGSPHGRMVDGLLSAILLGALVGGLVALCFNSVLGVTRR